MIFLCATPTRRSKDRFLKFKSLLLVRVGKLVPSAHWRASDVKRIVSFFFNIVANTCILK